MCSTSTCSEWNRQLAPNSRRRSCRMPKSCPNWNDSRRRRLHACCGEDVVASNIYSDCWLPGSPPPGLVHQSPSVPVTATAIIAAIRQCHQATTHLPPPPSSTIATRFLSCPDTVLGCEGIHSRWQWICREKRGAKLPFVNALLRLSYTLRDGPGVPPTEELAPHFTALRHAAWLEYAEWSEKQIPRGSGTSARFCERFNLNTDEAMLLRAARTGDAAPKSKETSWANYCRQVGFT